MSFSYLIAALFASQVHAAEVKEFDLKEIRKVEFRNMSGTLEFLGIDSGKARVTAEKRQFGSHCQMTIENRGQTLFVEVRKSWSLSGNGCEVDFKIEAPKTAALELKSGSGDLNIANAQSDLEFSVGSGSVKAVGKIKELSGKAGSGDVTIDGLTMGGDLKIGSGRTKLTYAIAPAAGTLEIKSGSGDSEITFPKKAKIRTSFWAGSGELVNELGDTPSASFQVSVKAGSGNLHIIKR